MIKMRNQNSVTPQSCKAANSPAKICYSTNHSRNNMSLAGKNKTFTNASPCGQADKSQNNEVSCMLRYRKIGIYDSNQTCMVNHLNKTYYENPFAKTSTKQDMLRAIHNEISGLNQYIGC